MRASIAVILLALAGLAIWLLLAPGGSPEPLPDSTGPKIGQDDARSTPLSDAPGETPTTSSTRQKIGEPHPGEKTAPKGLFLHIQVLTAETSRPIVGAKILAQKSKGPEAGLFGRIRPTAPLAGPDTWPGTDENGQSKQGPFPPGQITLTIKSPGRVGVTILISLSAQTTEQSIFLHRGWSISGIALNALTGKPLSQATIYARACGPTRGIPIRGADTEKQTRSAENGTFQIAGLDPNRAWSISGVADNFISTPATKPAFPGTQSLRLAFQPLYHVEISLIPPPHCTPLQSIDIQINNIRNPNRPDDIISTDYRQLPPHPQGKPNYTIAGLPPGWHQLLITAVFKQVHRLSGITKPFLLTRKSQSPLRTPLILLSRIEGRLINRAGHSLLGAEVGTFDTLSSRHLKTSTNQDGDFRLYAPPGKQMNLVLSNQGISMVVPVRTKPGLVKLGTLTLPRRGGTISGTITNRQGIPQVEALVVFRREGIGFRSWLLHTDKQGGFSESGLPWGNWHVYSFKKGDSPPLSLKQDKSLATIVLTPGTPEQKLSLILK